MANHLGAVVDDRERDGVDQHPRDHQSRCDASWQERARGKRGVGEVLKCGEDVDVADGDAKNVAHVADDEDEEGLRQEAPVESG